MFSGRASIGNCTNLYFPQRELHFFFRDPSKDVTDFEGSQKIELGSRCGETMIFDYFQKQRGQKTYHPTSSSLENAAFPCVTYKQ